MHVCGDARALVRACLRVYSSSSGPVRCQLSCAGRQLCGIQTQGRAGRPGLAEPAPPMHMSLLGAMELGSGGIGALGDCNAMWPDVKASARPARDHEHRPHRMETSRGVVSRRKMSTQVRPHPLRPDLWTTPSSDSRPLFPDVSPLLAFGCWGLSDANMRSRSDSTIHRMVRTANGSSQTRGRGVALVAHPEGRPRLGWS